MMTPEQTIAYLDERSEAYAKAGDAQTAALYDVGARLATMLMRLDKPLLIAAPPGPNKITYEI